MSARRVSLRFVLRGHVQGIGLRPAVARLAQQLNLGGFVRNCPTGVEVVAQGHAAELGSFEAGLRAIQPNDSVEIIKDRFAGDVPSRFSIEASDVAGELTTRVPPDINTCADCLADAESVANRRYQYPFTSCARCGPRYSIIRAMPYDRAETRMSQFALCRDCSQEYESSDDRRFHAQTNACPSCGPQIWCCDGDGRIMARAHDAVDLMCRAIAKGQIVALKGVGGYLLLADATSETAVARLRQRKQRPAKPLAVLVASERAAEAIAQLSSAERRQLNSTAGPIVLTTAKPGNGLACNLYPGLREIGLMLPATVLHYEIARRCGPLVATSGNLEGDPLEYTSENAQVRLSSIADLFLHHDRPIERPIDDSVVRVIAGRPVTLRLARGFAPLVLGIPEPWRPERPIVALGGEQKSAPAICNGYQAVLAPHIGDLGSILSRERFCQQLDELKRLYQVDQPLLVTDQHPGYFTTALASDSLNDTLAVQHHHAHLAAAMLEHGWLDREVLGVVWDGTGYGTDTTVWGGEFLMATATYFRRVAHLRSFRLGGGDVAIRQPRRAAMSLIIDTFGAPEARNVFERLGWSDENGHFASLVQNTRMGIVTTSAGRLFDAAAAIVFGIEHAEFEGQPAMLLESACDRISEGHYPVLISDGEPYQLDWRAMMKAMLADVYQAIAPGTIAMRFHRGLATAIRRVCERFPGLPVALCGGVFQNRLLVELLEDELRHRQQSVGLPGMIPPNDGGLAAGQLVVALAGLSPRQRYV